MEYKDHCERLLVLFAFDLKLLHINKSLYHLTKQIADKLLESGYKYANLHPDTPESWKLIYNFSDCNKLEVSVYQSELGVKIEVLDYVRNGIEAPEGEDYFAYVNNFDFLHKNINDSAKEIINRIRVIQKVLHTSGITQAIKNRFRNL